jgi:hypothetical protein
VALEVRADEEVPAKGVGSELLEAVRNLGRIAGRRDQEFDPVALVDAETDSVFERRLPRGDKIAVE